MLREINSSNMGSSVGRLLSRTPDHHPFVQPRETLIQSIDNTRQGESDQRKTGYNTAGSVLDNFVDYLA